MMCENYMDVNFRNSTEGCLEQDLVNYLVSLISLSYICSYMVFHWFKL